MKMEKTLLKLKATVLERPREYLVCIYYLPAFLHDLLSPFTPAWYSHKNEKH